MSDADKVVSGKKLFNATVTCIIIKQIDPGYNLIWILPLMEGMVIPGVPCKSSEMRLEQLPSTMCVHKWVDNSDNRFSGLYGPAATNYLVNVLRMHRFGKYEQVNGEDTPRKGFFIRGCCSYSNKSYLKTYITTWKGKRRPSMGIKGQTFKILERKVQRPETNKQSNDKNQKVKFSGMK